MGSQFKSVLKGDCVCCGLCCLTPVSRCEHLEILTAVGLPWSTRCKVYSQRYDGMPVIHLDKKSGHVLGVATCWKDSVAEDNAILESGIGKGCSLEVVNAKVVKGKA